MANKLEKTFNVVKTFLGKDAGQTTGTVLLIMLFLYWDEMSIPQQVTMALITLIINAIFNTIKDQIKTIASKLESALRTIFILEHGVEPPKDENERETGSDPPIIKKLE